MTGALGNLKTRKVNWTSVPFLSKETIATSGTFGQEPKAIWTSPQSAVARDRSSSIYQPRMEG